MIKKYVRCIFVLLALVLSLSTQSFAAGTKNLKYKVTEYNYIPVLMYHHITENQIQTGDSTVVTQAQLEENIRTLIDNGYTFISLWDLYNTKQNTDWSSVRMTNSKKYVCLTFDDGYESNYKLLYPLLKKYGIKADISVITQRCYPSYQTKAEENPKMTWDELNEMAKSGLVQIYNHSIDHEKFDENKGWQFIQKAITAEDQLDWNLDVKRNIHVFTYPNGETTPWLEKQMKKAGFDMQLTTESKVVCGTTPLYNVPRITVCSGESGKELLEKIDEAAYRTFAAYWKKR